MDRICVRRRPEAQRCHVAHTDIEIWALTIHWSVLSREAEVVDISERLKAQTSESISYAQMAVHRSATLLHSVWRFSYCAIQGSPAAEGGGNGRQDRRWRSESEA